MTVIVGLLERSTNRIYIGGDSAGVCGTLIQPVRQPKVFARGPFLLGHTSTFRIGNLLQYGGEIPTPPEGVDLPRWMSTVFVDAIRGIMKDGGHAMKNNDRESSGVFIVGVKGKLFRFESDYGFTDSHDDYLCAGAGEDFAHGSLQSTGALNLPGRKRVELALEATAHHCTAVTGPFQILCSEEEGGSR